jgi:hypothetical protein
MGLDVYVGPLTRYTLGEWLTIVQQAGLDAGHQVEIVRAVPEPEDVINDPVEIKNAVSAWQRGLLEAISGGEPWPDDADLPYWTDKLDWDGYGGLVLLAAYDEKPDLRPGRHTGLSLKRARADSARKFGEARAYKQAAKSPSRYPTLLAGVEWWLPITAGPSVFSTQRLTGQPTRMGRIDQLVIELETLADRIGLGHADDLERLRQQGSPSSGDEVDAAGRFGLAVFLALALTAQRERLPLLLDY